MSIEDARLRMLKFRAGRRGFREADLILGPFAEKHVGEMTPEQLDEFEILLEVPDHDLYNWIIGRDPTPVQYDGWLLNKIKEFRFEAHEVRGEDRGS